MELSTINSNNGLNPDPEPGPVDSDSEAKMHNGGKRLYYTLEENPPWYLTLVIGFQVAINLI
jgi:hypothetical protein